MRSTILVFLAACAPETAIVAGLDPVVLDEGAALGPNEREDVFVQTLVPASDVLFVVDNSCSMANEQALLAENFSAFLDTILQSETDFHVGVVSTDMTDPLHAGRLQESLGLRWIDPETEQPEIRYEEMVLLGVTGDPDERGRDAAFAALEGRADEANAGFLREEASLHVMVVSDENDASVDISIGELVEYLRGLKAAPFEATFSSVIGPMGSSLTPFGTCSAEYGADYVAITSEVGGIEFSICKEDWGPVLAELGSRASGLRTEFFLTARPVPVSIEVTIEVDGEPVAFERRDGGFIYDDRRNTVRIVNTLPPDGAIIRVRYTLAAP